MICWNLSFSIKIHFCFWFNVERRFKFERYWYELIYELLTYMQEFAAGIAWYYLELEHICLHFVFILIWTFLTNIRTWGKRYDVPSPDLYLKRVYVGEGSLRNPERIFIIVPRKCNQIFLIFYIFSGEIYSP